MNYKIKVFLTSIISLAALTLSGCGSVPTPVSGQSSSTQSVDFSKTPLTVTRIQVAIPSGYDPFDTKISKLFDSVSPYNLDVKKGNYVLNIVNRQGVYKLIHNGSELYSGKLPPVPEMSPNGKYVAYHIQQKDGLELFFNNKLVRKFSYGRPTDTGEISFAEPESCFTKMDMEKFRVAEDESVSERKFSSDCTHYIEAIMHTDGSHTIIYDGTELDRTYLNPGYVQLSENGEHYGYIAPDTKIDKEVVYIDGKNQLVAKELTDIQVSNAGNWVVMEPSQDSLNTPSKVYVNGQLLPTAVTDGNAITNIELNSEGTAYYLETPSVWILSDGQKIAHTQGDRLEFNGAQLYFYDMP